MSRELPAPSRVTSKRMPGRHGGILLLMAFVLCGSALGPDSFLGATDYYPLGIGYQWRYTRTFMRGGQPETVNCTTSVTGRDGDVFTVKGMSCTTTERPVQVEADRVYLVSGPEQRSLMLDFTLTAGGPGVTLPGPGDTLTLEATNETVQVPAGTFTGCYKFHLAPAPFPLDRPVIDSWYAPHVGLVKVRSSGFAGIATDELISFTFGTSFRRGDSTDNGGVDISDPIATLGCLFTGSVCSTCPDAADSNDDGKLDISDPIYTLDWLFTGGPAPPSPGATACETDPTDDALAACVYENC